MTDIRDALHEVKIARGDWLRIESERKVVLGRLAERLGAPRDSGCDSLELIQQAECDAAHGILTGDPDEDLLAALQEVYTFGVRHQGAGDAVRCAVARLRSALLRLPNPPRREDVESTEQCEAIAARVVCQEWLARRLTAPLPEPAVTDSDGRPVEEVGHE